LTMSDIETMREAIDEGDAITVETNGFGVRFIFVGGKPIGIPLRDIDVDKFGNVYVKNAWVGRKANSAFLSLIEADAEAGSDDSPEGIRQAFRAARAKNAARKRDVFLSGNPIGLSGSRMLMMAGKIIGSPATSVDADYDGSAFVGNFKTYFGTADAANKAIEIKKNALAAKLLEISKKSSIRTEKERLGMLDPADEAESDRECAELECEALADYRCVKRIEAAKAKTFPQLGIEKISRD
jgi:hypothetical protein